MDAPKGAYRQKKVTKVVSVYQGSKADNTLIWYQAFIGVYIILVKKGV